MNPSKKNVNMLIYWSLIVYLCYPTLSPLASCLESTKILRRKHSSNLKTCLTTRPSSSSCVCLRPQDKTISLTYAHQSQISSNRPSLTTAAYNQESPGINLGYLAYTQDTQDKPRTVWSPASVISQPQGLCEPEAYNGHCTMQTVQFLAASSSSRSLVVCRSVGRKTLSKMSQKKLFHKKTVSLKISKCDKTQKLKM